MPLCRWQIFLSFSNLKKRKMKFCADKTEGKARCFGIKKAATDSYSSIFFNFLRLLFIRKCFTCEHSEKLRNLSLNCSKFWIYISIPNLLFPKVEWVNRASNAKYYFVATTQYVTCEESRSRSLYALALILKWIFWRAICYVPAFCPFSNMAEFVEIITSIYIACQI